MLFVQRCNDVSLDQLTQLKNFLADRPEWAFLTISMMVNATLFTLYVRALNARVRDAQRWFPVAKRLGSMLNTAAAKARRNRPECLAEREKEE